LAAFLAAAFSAALAAAFALAFLAALAETDLTGIKLLARVPALALGVVVTILPLPRLPRSWLISKSFPRRLERSPESLGSRTIVCVDGLEAC